MADALRIHFHQVGNFVGKLRSLKSIKRPEIWASRHSTLSANKLFIALIWLEFWPARLAGYTLGHTSDAGLGDSRR